tara:strand:+ start:795 stop:956 length:162 start_codon:yes stop_codon:yes gene_type:complete
MLNIRCLAYFYWCERCLQIPYLATGNAKGEQTIPFYCRVIGILNNAVSGNMLS